MTVSEFESRLTTLEQKMSQMEMDLERERANAGIRRAIEESYREPGRPAREVIAEIRAKRGLPQT